MQTSTILTAVLTTLAPLTAQLGWSRVNSTNAPAPRFGHAMVSESLAGRIVLFGGTDGTAVFGDTWAFGVNGWQPLAPPTAPAARFGHAMAYDDLHARAMMFGGTDAAGQVLGDTWRFDGAGWSRVTMQPSPPARTGSQLVFDEWRLVFVLFGGRDAAGQPLGDTWEFDGQAWTERTPAVAPPPRYGHMLAPSTNRTTVLLCGGEDPNGVRNDAWEWDGTDWRPTAAPPTATTGAAGAFVPSPRYRVLTFGGRDASGAVRGDTLEFDAHADWLDHGAAAAVRPAPRDLHALAALDFGRDVVMFGGRDAAGHALGDTWRLAPTHPAAIASFGHECGGDPWGTGPRMVQIRQPLRGDADFRVLAFAGPSVPAALLVGVLEVDEPFGACHLLVDPMAAVGAVTSVAGSVSVPLPIPFDLGLSGVQVSAQLLAADPLGFAGIGSSDGLRLTIGD